MSQTTGSKNAASSIKARSGMGKKQNLHSMVLDWARQTLPSMAKPTNYTVFMTRKGFHKSQIEEITK